MFRAIFTGHMMTSTMVDRDMIPAQSSLRIEARGKLCENPTLALQVLLQGLKCNVPRPSNDEDPKEALSIAADGNRLTKSKQDRLNPEPKHRYGHEKQPEEDNAALKVYGKVRATRAAGEGLRAERIERSRATQSDAPAYKGKQALRGIRCSSGRGKDTRR